MSGESHDQALGTQTAKEIPGSSCAYGTDIRHSSQRLQAIGGRPPEAAIADHRGPYIPPDHRGHPPHRRTRRRAAELLSFAQISHFGGTLGEPWGGWPPSALEADGPRWLSRLHFHRQGRRHYELQIKVSYRYPWDLLIGVTIAARWQRLKLLEGFELLADLEQTLVWRARGGAKPGGQLPGGLCIRVLVQAEQDVA